jgi:hypothetical protein
MGEEVQALPACDRWKWRGSIFGCFSRIRDDDSDLG